MLSSSSQSSYREGEATKGAILVFISDPGKIKTTAKICKQETREFPRGVGWNCLLRGQLSRADHPDIQLGNDDSEISRVITSYWIHIMDGPGIMTNRPELQGDTDDTTCLFTRIDSL